MATRDHSSFARMARAFPVRTGLFTLGPLIVGFAQLLNAAVHGTAVVPVAAVTVVMIVFSVLVTGYHLAKFRRRTLLGDLPQSSS